MSNWVQLIVLASITVFGVVIVHGPAYAVSTVNGGTPVLDEPGHVVGGGEVGGGVVVGGIVVAGGVETGGAVVSGGAVVVGGVVVGGGVVGATVGNVPVHDN